MLRCSVIVEIDLNYKNAQNQLINWINADLYMWPAKPNFLLGKVAFDEL